MAEKPPIHAVIELALDGAGIEGVLRVEQAEARSFSGMLGLFAALEAARAAAEGRTEDGP